VHVTVNTGHVAVLCVILCLVTRAGSGKYCAFDSFFDFGAIYIVCLFASYVSPLMPFLYFFPYLSFTLRIDPLRFEAGGRKRRPNLDFLVVYGRPM